MEKLRDIGRVYHATGAQFVGEGAVTPSRAEYQAAAEEAGVPYEVMPTIWQIETRQLALLDGQPLVRIESAKWKQFGGDPRDLPKPLNPGGATAADTAAGQKKRWINFDALSAIDPVRAIVSSSHGGSQIMGWWAEYCGFVDERAFLAGMRMGPAMQLIAMARLIKHPKNAAMRAAMQRKDPDAIAHHWNGPAYRKHDYQKLVAAGLRRFA